MIIDSINTDNEVLIVAEIGNNHEGKVGLAEEMIHAAAATGVQAVKFQTFRTEHYVTRRDTARFARLKSFELSFDEFEQLSKLAKSLGLLFLSTPFDLESAEFLKGIVSAFKIASGDNNFYPLIDNVARSGKPVILSTGMVNMDQIREAVCRVEDIWKAQRIKQELAVLHCVTSYPVPPREANVRAVMTLKREFGCTVGYSDHTLGIQASVLATALGARIIEKHFTLNKKQSDFRDHQLSADPAEMKELVQQIRQVPEFLGTGEKQLQESEKEITRSVRRSIVAKRDLSKGAKISWDDLTWVRPADGLPPGKESLLVGKILNQPVTAGQLLTVNLLES
jgi:N,N'-diacetyllegionaminate synthase